MASKKVQVEILEHTGDYVKVKLPFLKVPVTMNQYFFKDRISSGYFIPLKVQTHKMRNNKEKWKA